MIIVGLTGGYASGKNTVAGMFVEMGAALIDADNLAREVVRPHTQAWYAIQAHFGNGILLTNGEIDRKALGEIVFRSEKERESLNRIVHPRVLEEELKAIEAIRVREPGAVVILSVPLLIESGHYRHCHKIVVVDVEGETQIKRLMKRDGFSREEAIRRISAQMPLPEKIKYADFVVDNSGELENTRRQAQRIFKKLKAGG